LQVSGQYTASVEVKPIHLRKQHFWRKPCQFHTPILDTCQPQSPLVTVGTPPQEQVVILDTGSSDLYFDSSTAATCQKTGLYSCRGGTFNHADSSTYKIVAQSPAFNTSFGDGSTATGPFAEDVVGIGDVRIDSVQFGVADEVDSTTGYAVGLMGLGYSENEASQRQYPNIPEVLASSGEINSRLYSIYLNDIGEWEGLTVP
jgi:hypothetical protein